MNISKKILNSIKFFSVLLFCSFIFVSCNKVCSSCGQSKKCQKISFLGMETYVCHDCISDFANELNSATKELDSAKKELDAAMKELEKAGF